ncbi:hypothetical protein BGZ63DRAFT_408024 [Mariannaea sp. PMI_226]|nr:hypothetical protein BGZ63DRAFT_408024 [Mariannaea sp. PMI_226]
MPSMRSPSPPDRTEKISSEKPIRTLQRPIEHQEEAPRRKLQQVEENIQWFNSPRSALSPSSSVNSYWLQSDVANMDWDLEPGEIPQPILGRESPFERERRPYALEFHDLYTLSSTGTQKRIPIFCLQVRINCNNDWVAHFVDWTLYKTLKFNIIWEI